MEFVGIQDFAYLVVEQRSISKLPTKIHQRCTGHAVDVLHLIFPQDETQSSFTAFAGEGQRLRMKKNKNKDNKR